MSAPRAVILVGNPAAPYSRALRIARTLAGDGFDVEIAAIAADGVPDVEQDGSVTIRRYHPTGWFAGRASTHVVPAAAVAATRAAPAWTGPAPLRTRIRRRLGRMRRRARSYVAWVLWPQTVRGWWATLARDLGPADLYHACGSLTIAPALASAGRARRTGRRPVVIYDAIDNVFEGNNVLEMSAVLRRLHAARERRWARAADARISVNEALAVRLAERWAVPRLVSVPNYPARWDARSADAPDHIRAALGLPPEMRIVLFQGRLSPNLGLDEAAEAVLRVDDACLVLLGFGRWTARCQARDQDPRFMGRHFTLPAVHPDELPAWTASADVSLVTLPPVSVNQRESTPNKFWESLLVGTPILLGPGLDVMAGIVIETRAGLVARSLEPDAVADAINEILARPAAERDANRRRVAALAAERYTWPVAAERYRAVVRRLAEPAGSEGG